MVFLILSANYERWSLPIAVLAGLTCWNCIARPTCSSACWQLADQ
jgi:hypothetical protein